MPQVEKNEIVKRSKTLRELAQQKKIQHFTKLKNKPLSVLMESDFRGRAEDFSEITTSVPLQPGKIYQLKARNHNNDCLIADN
jgi:tRNA A37 methylthiotransferase MiaB